MALIISDLYSVPETSASACTIYFSFSSASSNAGNKSFQLKKEENGLKNFHAERKRRGENGSKNKLLYLHSSLSLLRIFVRQKSTSLTRCCFE